MSEIVKNVSQASGSIPKIVSLALLCTATNAPIHLRNAPNAYMVTPSSQEAASPVSKSLLHNELSKSIFCLPSNVIGPERINEKIDFFDF
jgi:hypothetical protein